MNILEAVKKRGGASSRAIFPREKTLDQMANMEMRIKSDMVRPKYHVCKNSFKTSIA